jgi:hypothetical protein
VLVSPRWAAGENRSAAAIIVSGMASSKTLVDVNNSVYTVSNMLVEASFIHSMLMISLVW